MEYLATGPLTDATLGETANMVGFRTSQGLEVQATLIKLTPQSVTFEMYTPETVVRLSEMLSEFRIFADTRSVYSGNAVVSSMVHTGAATVCEVTLKGALLDLDLFQLGSPDKVLPAGFEAFLGRWEKFYQVSSDYKLAVADLQNFLEELRLWLDQVELGVRALPSGERLEMERAILKALPAMPAISALFERFELAATLAPEHSVAAHRAFCRRQLHPLLLSAPFMHRIYAKPLGYAGDYEMIDMIIRNDCEGGSLFAKLLHMFILDQTPARSVRNRVDYFVDRFVEETSRVIRLGRDANFFSLGCGPAREVQSFLAKHPVSDRTRFTLLDFNEETLRHTSQCLEDVKRQFHRRTPVKLIKKTVHYLLKANSKPGPGELGYDFIYCSGLYDYLSDRVCKALNTYLYDQLRPGGLLTVTNFDPSNPIRQIQEHLFDWFLIYRDGTQLAALAPEQALEDHCTVTAEYTGCNIFLQIRKPSQ
jgi:extracellular factor (EF) 3-hydroxypalmitic acid methyl ester biosynthesis protein